MSFAEMVDKERTAKTIPEKVRSLLREEADHYHDFAVTSTKENGEIHFWIEAFPHNVFVRTILREVSRETAEHITGKSFGSDGRVLGDIDGSRQ